MYVSIGVYVCVCVCVCARARAMFGEGSRTQAVQEQRELGGALLLSSNISSVLSSPINR